MKKKKILLVDNESIMAQTIDLALKHFGYEVSCFTRGLEALADFKLHPAEFHLIITDQSMPDLEWNKLVEEVLRIRPDIPIILYGDMSMNEADAKAKGIRKFLIEPFSLSELGEVVRQVLHQS